MTPDATRDVISRVPIDSEAAPRRPAFRAALATATESKDARAFLLFMLISALFLGAWELLVRSGTALPIVPSPTKVFVAGVDALSSAFYESGVNDVGVGLQLVASLQRVLIGFTLAAVVAVPLGFVLGMSEVAAKAVDPFVQVLRPVSPLAWLPIGLALLKTSEGTAIFVIFISAIWPLLINTMFAVRTVPKEYVDVARTLKASNVAVIRAVLLPASIPGILTGMRISFGVAWLVIVAAEMLIGGRGIGYSVWNEWNNLSIANIIVDIVLIGMIGLCFDRVFELLIQKVRYDL
jgi:nitrate/nitrite transport system permease protein